MERLTLARHRLGDAYRSAVASITTQSTESKFVESGTLTPDEFVQAGDQLAFKFPTWRWEAGESSRRASCLPPEQQYLITRNVPCRDRVRALDYVLKHQTRTVDEWLLPETASGEQAPADICDVDDLATDDPALQDGAGGIGEDDAGGIGGIILQEDFITAPAEASAVPDYSDLDAELAEEDPAAMANADEDTSAYLVADAPDANILRTRTYDLSITYDKYYQTPRLWLFGYDEQGQPLRPDQVYEDVLSEYVAKTVTVDPHPLTGTPTVSIHPCKHAQVMKKVVADWIEQGIEPRHDLALFVFLKFISSVVPTINYDFTMDIEF